MLAAGDAIGNHVLRIQAVLRAAGYDSRVYAEEIHPGVAGRADHYTAFAGDGRILYHLSTSCPPMADLVAGHARRHGPGAVVVDYHHITPPEFFDRWEPWAAESARRARTEMAGLAPHIGLALADSSYSEDDLRASGYTRTAVVPILIDFAGYDGPGEGDPAAGGGGGARWLFVGRVAPNKCQHDVIGAFAVYRELFDPAATLTLVGGVTSAAYRRALGRLVARLRLGDSVAFTGAVNQAELLARYRAASVFVCASEHEGFCVPLLEAMHFGVPVVAYAGAAVPETVGDAGVCLPAKDPVLVATAVHRVHTDADLRRRMVDAGHDRVARHALERTAALLLDLLCC